MIVVGSANVDTVVDVAHFPHVGETITATSLGTNGGGKGLNQAVAAARAGAAVRFIAAVGDDAAGRYLMGLLEADGVDVGGVVRVAGVPTGSAIVTVDARGDNTVMVAPGANHHLEPSAVLLERGAAQVVLVQQEIPAPSVLAALQAGRACGARTVLNPAPAWAELSDAVLALVDVLVPNQTELARCSPGAGSVADRASALVARGARAVVVTLGGEGALVVTASARWPVAPFAVAVRDTTGAGDTFCATLAVALGQGMDLPAAARRAAAAGALATTGAGAYPSLPWARDVDRLLGVSP
jgi:ribokinase